MRNRRLLITVLCLAMTLGVSLGLASAYFTDYEYAKGGAVLDLKGQTVIHEDVNEWGKTVSIKNVEETDMIVRVKFIGDAVHMQTPEAGAYWSGPDDDGWYYYTKVLKGASAPGAGDGDSTSDIKAEIRVTEQDLVTDFDIIVVHEAEIVVYDEDNQTVKIPDGWNVGSISAE